MIVSTNMVKTMFNFFESKCTSREYLWRLTIESSLQLRSVEPRYRALKIVHPKVV